MTRIVLVTGATGKQGGATAHRLLADGWRVRALVRDPSAAAARELEAAGAELVRGDMGDRAALDAAAEGAYGVFSVQPTAGSPDFDHEEVRLGVNVADAARQAGVKHLVYTSVGALHRAPTVRPWAPKLDIERHVRASGVPYTILRPVQFMSNHLDPRFGVFGETALVRIIPRGMTVQLIAVADIGAFAGLAFGDPDAYVGREIELAGDELPRDSLVAAVREVVGVPIDTDPLPAELRERLGGYEPDLTGSFAGWSADVPMLRRLHPGLMDFATWMEREGAAAFRALAAGGSVGRAS
ncbi:NmrA family NAD(P)-binding protein [Nonomuraea mangrovi]|uniref:NmrA family NAD(P)-binding protein n=1 Tax=Nonomuraea mangrovi TaxID=2316207 RepID=A0ABW4T9G7_9ACTN